MSGNIHIGSIIRQVLDRSGMTYKEFARNINCERQSLYYLFGCKSIDVDRLILISRVLGYDFLRNVYLNEDYDRQFKARNTVTLTISRAALAAADDIVVRLKKD